jgi:Nucleotidyl transferase AbiEii toxin, Type IV TA system
MDSAFYFEALYPLQDDVLRRITELNTPLYLTGGTAASRGYLRHRFSDDLDLFTNDDPQFQLWAEQVVDTLAKVSGWNVQVTQREERFVRLAVVVDSVPLKIEMINDVPSHLGSIRVHETLGRLDSPENILANKVSALMDREEPKDFADIWGFASRLGMSLSEAISGAQSKAAGIFPADLARLLCTATREDWQLVRWIEAPTFETFLFDLSQLGGSLLMK